MDWRSVGYTWRWGLGWASAARCERSPGVRLRAWFRLLGVRGLDIDRCDAILRLRGSGVPRTGSGAQSVSGTASVCESGLRGWWRWALAMVTRSQAGGALLAAHAWSVVDRVGAVQWSAGATRPRLAGYPAGGVRSLIVDVHDPVLAGARAEVLRLGGATFVGWTCARAVAS